MKFIQTSDLHLGKKLRERSLKEDQDYILKQIVDLAVKENVDGLIIAGDVFDDGNSSSADAVTSLDMFLTDLCRHGIETYIISGNHDSMDRLAFGREIFRKNGIHIVSQLEEEMPMYVRTNKKEGRSVDIFMLPFIKPVHARRAFGDDSITDYNSAVAAAIDHFESVDDKRFRILVTHQFVTSAGISPERSESEKVYVGNTENVDASLFDRFDYVALGHIHKAQDVGSPKVHYCGAPLKYSVSEHADTKSVTMIEIDDDGFRTTMIPLKPLREVRLVTGPLDRILEAAKNESDNDDFVYARLEDAPDNAMARLREVFPNIVGMDTPSAGEELPEIDVDIEEGIDDVSLFCDFYRACTGEYVTDEQMRIIEDLLAGEGSE